MKRLLFLTFILANFQTFAQNQNVLFIGNSYTHYNNMPKLFERIAKANNEMVYADSIAVSGSTLKQHSERPTTYDKMKSRPWDIVVIQGFSREFAQDSSVIMTETIPYVRQLIDSVLTFSPDTHIYRARGRIALGGGMFAPACFEGCGSWWDQERDPLIM